MSIVKSWTSRSSERECRTWCLPPSFPVAIENQETGGSPMNTHIPSTSHANQGAPYPSGGSASVHPQLSGYDDRHGEKWHLPSHLLVPSPCCTVKLELPSHGTHIPPPLYPLRSFSFSLGREREDDPRVQDPAWNASLSPCGADQSQRD